jgi:hypothetical protein
MSTYEGNEYVVEQARTNVFKRLYDTKNYTGVYAERFRAGGDGRINGQTQVSLRATHAHFKGNTNTGTDEVIHDISKLMRPNLRHSEEFNNNHSSVSDLKRTRAQRRFSSATGVWKDSTSGRAINEGGTLMDSSMQTMSTSDQLKFIFKDRKYRSSYPTFGHG